ncbi:MAG TPA: hypothetical protein VGC27_08610 [Rhizomicrobium sp.]
MPGEEQSSSLRDEELRRLAAERLAEHLDIGASLIARCEHLAELPKGDRLGAIYAAARLMHANAHVARAFAQVAQLERRQRTIIEHIQPLVLKSADSNSSLENELERELRLKMLRYMKLVAAETLDPALDEAAAAAPEDNAFQNDAPQKTPLASALGSSAGPA